ncbi:MAG: hypothetical protein QNK04_27580 [Myxococcota bacterium]|nr:hypothetical protein [Myxococcota bacterium]
MEAMAQGGTNDDPRKLRDLLTRAAELAHDHSVHTTVVGMASSEGDALFPEFVDFVESALRMDDAIFRMTRERSVLLLSDVDRSGADEILSRLLADFRANFANLEDPEIRYGYFEVEPGAGEISVKRVLPTLFGVRPN